VWLTWNTNSFRRGFGGIACYIKMNISPHIWLHKKDPLNQTIWMEISYINTKKIDIAICYFTPINSTFYTKNSLDKNCPYKSLEQDIYNMKNEGSILLLGDFNTINETNQAIILSNDSNPNTLWLDEDIVLDNKYKRNFEDLIENLFGTELIKLCNSRDLIICNGLMKWTKSNSMTCIHRLGSGVVDYVISNIPIYNQIVNFDLLDDHEPNSNHIPLTLTLNFSMHKGSIEEHFDNQRHLLFDKQKVNLFLKDLSNALNIITYHNNIEVDYQNFTTILSTSINKFSIDVLYKKKNSTTNPWYDHECKIVRKVIRDASNASLKYDKINRYKSLIKRGEGRLYK
jgi:hypothetical protein